MVIRNKNVFVGSFKGGVVWGVIGEKVGLGGRVKVVRVEEVKDFVIISVDRRLGGRFGLYYVLIRIKEFVWNL